MIIAIIIIVIVVIIIIIIITTTSPLQRDRYAPVDGARWHLWPLGQGTGAAAVPDRAGR